MSEEKSELVSNEVQEVKKLRVYKHKSTFKGASDNDFWFTATRSDGSSIKCIFKCTITTDSMAFEISKVKGSMSVKNKVEKGETFTNYTYYITSCVFSEIEGEELEL